MTNTTEDAMGPNEFVRRANSDVNFLLGLLFLSDLDDELKKQGFDLPDNFLAYVKDSLEKIRVYIRDQNHVLEIKAQQLFKINSPAAGSGGNGAPGTGW